MAELSSTSVKLVGVCSVAPQPQPDVAEFSLLLTFFDLLWLRFPHFHRLFFYEILASSALADTKPFFDSLLHQKLKASLSVTLQHFLPLAGNITWPQDSHKPVLSYVQGDAVSLTTAHSDADFHRLSSNDFNIEAKEYHPLVPQLAISREKAAVMAFQITLFPNSSGFSIGISMHHAALDGKTLFMFLKSWAHLCKHEPDTLLPDQLKPFYDRSVFIQDPAGLELEAIYLNQFLNMDQRPNNRSLMVATRYKTLALPDSIRGTFEFTSTKIDALRQSVMIKKHQQYHQSVRNLSTFCLTCAYTWVCLVKAEQEEEEEEEEIKDDQILMVLSVDCRSRLDPPIPATYFGNCITGHGAFAGRKGLLGEDGFFVAVNAISEAIKGLNNGVLNGAGNLVSSLYLSESDLQAPTDHSRVFTTAGSHQFKMYDTDFGWGRPKSTEVVPIGRRGAITFSDGKNGGGAVDIGLVLQKHHMEVFASLFPKKAENNLPASAPPASVPEASAPTSTSTPESNDTNEEVEGYSVYIRNLPLNVTADQLEEEFKKFGPIKQGGIQVRNKKLQGYCFGFVEFLSASSMNSAIQASPISFGGRQAVIEIKRTTTRVGSSGRGRFPPPGRGGFRSDSFRGRGNYVGGRSFGRNEYGNRGEFSSRGRGPAGRGGDGYQQGRGRGGRPSGGPKQNAVSA